MACGDGRCVRDPPRDPPATPHYRVDLRIETTKGHKLSAPPSFVAAGQVATLSAQRSTSFVQDVDIEVQGTSFIADPIVGVVADGIHVELAAAPAASSDQQSWLALRTTFAHLHKPIRQRSIRCAKSATPSVVQFPHFATEQLGTALLVREGQATLIARIPTPDDATAVSIWATLHRVGAITSPTFAPDPPASDDEVSKDAVRMGNALLPARPLTSLLRDALACAGDRESLHVQFVNILGPRDPSGPVPEALTKELVAVGQTIQSEYTLAPLKVVGTTAHSLSQHSYVQDFDPAGPLEVIKTKDGERKFSKLGVYDPTIGSLQEGQSVTLIRNKDGLALRLTWTEIVSPIEQFDVELDADFGVTIELPELRLMQTHINLTSGRVTPPAVGYPPRTPANGFDLRQSRYLIPLAMFADAEGGVGTRAVWIEINKTPRPSSTPK